MQGSDDIAEEASGELKSALGNESRGISIEAPMSPTCVVRVNRGGPSSGSAPRKKPFRFSYDDDVGLLRVTVDMFPYGSSHGHKQKKWEAVASELYSNGMMIDWRRARDRADLLLDSFRRKEISTSTEELSEKDRLLTSLLEMQSEFAMNKRSLEFSR